MDSPSGIEGQLPKQRYSDPPTIKPSVPLRQSSPAVVAQASTTINRSAEEDVSLIDNSTTHDKILVDDESVLPDHHYCHIEDIDEAASDGVTEKDTTCLQQWDQRPSLEDRLAVDQLEDTLNASGSGENVGKKVTPRRPNTILRNFDPLLNEEMRRAMDESKLEEESTDWSSDDEDTVNGNGNYDSIRCMSPPPTCQPPDRLAPQDQLGCHAISSEGPLPPPTPPPRALPPHRPLYENVSIVTPPRNLQTTEAKDLEDKLYQTVVLESPPNSILFDHKGASLSRGRSLGSCLDTLNEDDGGEKLDVWKISPINGTAAQSSSRSSLNIVSKVKGRLSSLKIKRTFSPHMYQRTDSQSSTTARKPTQEEGVPFQGVLSRDIVRSRLPQLSILSKESNHSKEQGCDNIKKSDHKNGVTQKGTLHTSLTSSKVADFIPRYCVLGNGSISVFNSILSSSARMQIPLQRIQRISRQDSRDVNKLFSFQVEFTEKHALGREESKTVSFSSDLAYGRDQWVRSILQLMSPSIDLSGLEENSSNRLEGDTSERRTTFIPLSMKTLSASEWNKASWLQITSDLGRCLRMQYFNSPGEMIPKGERVREKPTHGDWTELSLKQIKAISTFLTKTPKKNKSLDEVPTICVDCVDGTHLYLMTRQLRDHDEILVWLESGAFAPPDWRTAALQDFQVSSRGVPVIIDKCLDFVFTKGIHEEGIYRKPGTHSKIDAILKSFLTEGRNAWESLLHLYPDEYSPHEVADALRRFLREREEPLLLPAIQQQLHTVSHSHNLKQKIEGYTRLLGTLPSVHFKSLKYIAIHLRSIASQESTNKMELKNLTTIWAKVLMKANHEGTGLEGAKVVHDIIANCIEIFKISKEELDQEAIILNKLVQINQLAITARTETAGESTVLTHVSIDSKHSGEPIPIQISSRTTAWDCMLKLSEKLPSIKDLSDYQLHEVTLGERLERPIHHRESMLRHVVLKWNLWPEEDRIHNYLLFKRRDELYRETLFRAVPPKTSIVNAKIRMASCKDYKQRQIRVTNGRLKVMKKDEETHDWPVEELWWYFGSWCSENANPTTAVKLTFFERMRGIYHPTSQGNVISFNCREEIVDFVASLLVAEFDCDVQTPELGQRISWNM